MNSNISKYNHGFYVCFIPFNVILRLIPEFLFHIETSQLKMKWHIFWNMHSTQGRSSEGSVSCQCSPWHRISFVRPYMTDTSLSLPKAETAETKWETGTTFVKHLRFVRARGSRIEPRTSRLGREPLYFRDLLMKWSFGWCHIYYSKPTEVQLEIYRFSFLW